MAGILLLHVVVIGLVNQITSFVALPYHCLMCGFLFSQVYMNVLSSEDLLFIVSTLYPSIEHSMLLKMITFNGKVRVCIQVLSNALR